ncbi:MAG: hypothetical protein IT284_02345 [Bacteroidetes bacterium]|nr:hypothetical protein [Bacteroidota bacterium]
MDDIEIKAFFLLHHEKSVKIKLSIGRLGRIYYVKAYLKKSVGETVHIYETRDDKLVGTLKFELRLDGHEETLHLPEHEHETE